MQLALFIWNVQYFGCDCVIDFKMSKKKQLAGQARAMDKYELLEKIGEGSYGPVFKGRVNATGQMVALQKTQPQNANEGVPTSTLREIASLKKLSHCEHIVK